MPEMIPLYRAIAQTHAWAERAKSLPGPWGATTAHVMKQCMDMLPHGSGFDSAPTLESVKPDRLTVCGSYHAMDSNGSYCGWLDFTVTVKASLEYGIDVSARGAGAEHNDYIAETYQEALHATIDYRAMVAAAVAAVQAPALT